MDLDNAMKYQKTKSIYLEFSSILAHNINIENRPKPILTIFKEEFRPLEVEYQKNKNHKRPREKREKERRRKEEGRPRSLFWSLKSDFCKGFKILRLVCEFMS